MKFRDVFFDAATVVGCCVGVGFLSGKEAQIYFGNLPNVGIFAVLFFLFNIAIRKFCREQRCFGTVELFRRCLGRFAPFFSALFCFCCFVCIVTMFAGVENCLQRLLWQTKFPAYSFVVAIISALILKRGLSALKILNVVAVLVSLAYFFAAFLLFDRKASFLPVPPAQPVAYTLFSVTMSLGVLAPLSDSTKAKNLASTAVATAFLCVLTVAVLFCADFSLEMPFLGRSNSVTLNLLGGFAVTLTVVASVVANSLPITDCIASVFEDDYLCFAVLFGLAWAFSMFGFDFALYYGYLIVAFVGLLLMVVLVTVNVKRRVAKACKAKGIAKQRSLNPR